MTNEERKMFKTFMNISEEIVFIRLKNNLQYLEGCVQQEKTENIVGKLFQSFDRNDCIFIHRHYEGEKRKYGFRIDEVYLKCLKDSIKFLTFLRVFDMEVSL